MAITKMLRSTAKRNCMRVSNNVTAKMTNGKQLKIQCWKLKLLKEKNK